MWKIKLRVSTSSETVIMCFFDYIICGQVSDEDKTEALQAFMQVFKSMADVTSRILVGAVAARRSIHIKDLAFKYKTTENKRLVQSTLNSVLFVVIVLIFFTQV